MTEKLKSILKVENLKGKDLADLLNTKYSTYRSATRSNRKGYPKWVRAFIIGYELGKNRRE